MGPLLLDGVEHLPGQLGRRGARPLGVGEDVHGGEGALLDKVQGLLELLLRLAGEAHDEVGGNSGPVVDLVQEFYALIIPVGIIFPVHPGQHRVAPRLHGQVEVGAQVGQGSRPAAEVRGDGSGLQRAQAHPGVRGQPLTDGLNGLDELRLSLQVLSPGGDLDAGEDDLPVARRLQLPGLPDTFGQGEGAHPPPGVGDDAVGAEVDAPVLHLQHGPGAALQPAGGEGLEGAAGEGVVQGGDGLAVTPLPLQQVHKAGAVPSAGDQVHPQLLHVVRVGLGVAAAYGDDRVGGGLPGPADHLPGLLVADGGDGAGVDHIGVRRLLKGDQAVAPLGDQLLQGLGLVLVDLTTKCIKCNLHNKS